MSRLRKISPAVCQAARFSGNLPDVSTTANESGTSSLSSIAATRMRGLRAELRLSQSQLALMTGLSRTGVSDRESGLKAVDVDELPALAAALETSIEYLLGLTDVRARRDSNPKPSELEPRRVTAVVPPAPRLATVLPFCRPERPVERRRSA